MVSWGPGTAEFGHTQYSFFIFSCFTSVSCPRKRGLVSCPTSPLQVVLLIVSLYVNTRPICKSFCVIMRCECPIKTPGLTLILIVTLFLYVNCWLAYPHCMKVMQSFSPCLFPLSCISMCHSTQDSPFFTGHSVPPAVLYVCVYFDVQSMCDSTLSSSLILPQVIVYTQN